ncbi:MAG: hypothetical protein ABIY55_00875 [Kofleriaceae bacterium]
MNRSEGPVVAIGTTIYDLAQRRVLGEVAQVPLRIDRHGRALVATPGHGAARTEVPSGPLRWMVPRPVVSPAAPAELSAAPPAELSAEAPPWTLEGVAIDEAGVAMANVTVTRSEWTARAQQPDEASEWYPRTVTPNGQPGDHGQSSQYFAPDPTDRNGRFRWTPRRDTAYAVMLIAKDGRGGVSTAIAPGSPAAAIVLRAPGVRALRCQGFAHPSYQPFTRITHGAWHLSARCDERIEGLPSGSYTVMASDGGLLYATREVEVASGATTRV